MTRWVLGTAVGQVVFTGTVRLVLAVLMGAALGGLVVWLVLRRRHAPQSYAGTPAASTAGRPERRVRAAADLPNPGRPSRTLGAPVRRPAPAVERTRPRFSPRANSPTRPAPEHPAPGRSAPGRDTGARSTVGGGAGAPAARPAPVRK
ncbi:hypothetical protein ABGB07_38280 [Micromonosporaceae bacterium B7E4]